MDFRFTDEHRLLRETARRFTDQEVRPLARAIDEREAVPPELLRKAAELGFLGATIPAEYGGGEVGEVGYCIILEEIARGCNSTAVTIGGHASLGAMAICLSGGDEQKRRFLPDLAAGNRLAAYALTEPNAGSDAAAMRTSATRAKGHWTLNGAKTFITNGSIADVFVVFAVTEASRGIQGGITAFIVEKDRPGFRAGKPEQKMGIRGSHTTDLFFDAVAVPDENVLGAVGAGFQVAMQTLDVARVSLASQCLGGAKELLDLSLRYANERVQFGKPIARQEAIQFMLAEMAADIYQIESIVYRTAWLIDQGLPHHRESAICKLAASEAVCRIADKAVQIHGGMGYMREYPIERLYRDARINRIFEGTNEIQHIVIARDLIKQGAYANE